MPPLRHAILTVEGDPDGDGNLETGEFHLVGSLEITPGLRTGYLIGGRQSQVNSIIANLVDSGTSTNKQFFLDLGAGANTVEVSFRNWKGAKADLDGDGTKEPVQWGNTGDPSQVTQTDATGASAITQIDVLKKYLLTAEIDSTNPATLEYGEFSTDGLYEPMDVVIEGPQMTKAAEDGEWMDGSMTFIEAAAFDDVYDASQQLP